MMFDGIEEGDSKMAERMYPAPKPKQMRECSFGICRLEYNLVDSLFGSKLEWI